MQVRLDPDIAKKVKRNAKAHERMFKRRKSYSAEVNEMLRVVLFENGHPAKDEVRSLVEKAKVIHNWGNQPAKFTP